MEIPHGGVEIYYGLPAHDESSFHEVLIEKAQAELAKVGKVKALSRWGNQDLIFNERVAIEVETCVKTISTDSSTRSKNDSRRAMALLSL